MAEVPPAFLILIPSLILAIGSKAFLVYMFLSSKLKPKAASPILPVKTTRSPFLEVFFINGLSQRPSAVPDIIISLASLVSPPIKEIS